jgi:uncharacterized protein (TIGR02453 family)
VKEPFYALVSTVIEQVQQKEPELEANAKNAIFRIYRDVRFGKDKSPYKLHMAARISPDRKPDGAAPGMYFEVGARGGSIGGGIYQPTKEQLTLVRDLVMHEGKALRKLLKAKALTELFPEGLVGETNKVLPAEFKEAAATEPLLYNKQFLWWTTLGREAFMGKDAAKTLVKHYMAAKPVKDFFIRAFA